VLKDRRVSLVEKEEREEFFLVVVVTGFLLVQSNGLSPKEYFRTALNVGCLIKLGVSRVKGRKKYVFSAPDTDPPCG
jgi:hypothetical protein